MKKGFIITLFLFSFYQPVLAQDEPEDEGPKTGFHKENLFTGGNISLSFFNGGLFDRRKSRFRLQLNQLG